MKNFQVIIRGCYPCFPSLLWPFWESEILKCFLRVRGTDINLVQLPGLATGCGVCPTYKKENQGRIPGNSLDDCSSLISSNINRFQLWQTILPSL